VASLSSATITSIISRLESKQLVRKSRSTNDKRQVNIVLTKKGSSLLKKAPPLLQEKFIIEFTKLKDWEQSLILSSVMRIADMMDAESIDAAPLLSDGPVVPKEKNND
jgi:DNA-binding MarR family transcriptional regulator